MSDERRVPTPLAGLGSDVDPYTGLDYRTPSVIPSSGYVPPVGAPTEADAKAALLELANREMLGFGGRWCSACHSDLSDANKGQPHRGQPLSAKGFQESTGQHYEGRDFPQGGHTADCPVPVLLLWLGEVPSRMTRRREA